MSQNYTPVGPFIDDQAPALDAENLNAIETGIQAVDLAAQTSAANTGLLASVHDPFKPKFGAQVMASPPAVTYSTTAPSGGTSYDYVAGALLPAITGYGLLPATRVISGNTCLINASCGFTGTLPVYTTISASLPYWVEFDLYGDFFAAAFLNLQNAYNIWIWVDGQPATAAPAPMQDVASGLLTVMTVTFGSVALRRIKILMPEFIGLRTLYTDATGSITPTGKSGKSIAIVGDSWAAGVGANSLPQGWVTTFELETGLEVYRVAQQSTGYISVGSGAEDNFGGPMRLAALTAIQPDYILVTGTSNDDGQTEAAEQAAAAATYASYAQVCPNAKVGVVGPQNTTATVTSARALVVLGVQAAALAAPNVIGYVSPFPAGLTGWVTGTGSTGSPTGSGIADWFNNSLVASHPTQGGHDYWGRRTGAFWRGLINSILESILN